MKWYQNLFGRHNKHIPTVPGLESGRKALHIVTDCAVQRAKKTTIWATWWHSQNRIFKPIRLLSAEQQKRQTIYTDTVAMTAALATWADCWAVTGLQEDLIGRQALFRAHVIHYTASPLAGPRTNKVNHIKQVIKQSHCRLMIVRSKFTNCCFRWANTPGTAQKISIWHGRCSDC